MHKQMELGLNVDLVKLGKIMKFSDIYFLV